MNIYTLVVVTLLSGGLLARLYLRLYSQKTVAAVFKAIEKVAADNGRDLEWLKGRVAKDIKLHYVRRAYLGLPAILRAILSEQRFMDGVEREYRRAALMAADVLEHKDTLNIDLG